MESEIEGMGSVNQEIGSGIHEMGLGIHEMGYGIQETEFGIQEMWFEIQVIGIWNLGDGIWNPGYAVGGSQGSVEPTSSIPQNKVFWDFVKWNPPMKNPGLLLVWDLEPKEWHSETKEGSL